MEAGMYAMSIPLIKRGLTNLSALIDKAAAHVEAHKIDPAALINFRLYPDMLPFSKQIQVACDLSKGCAARLGGVAVPKHEDTETTFAELQARIAKTIAFIDTVDSKAIDASAANPIKIPIRDRELNLTGYSYLTQMALPNVYFHLTTAYAILRHNGVVIGKTDFIGPL
jgi:hypothetical protein